VKLYGRGTKGIDKKKREMRFVGAILFSLNPLYVVQYTGHVDLQEIFMHYKFRTSTLLTI
jgi:hypothetical protein